MTTYSFNMAVSLNLCFLVIFSTNQLIAQPLNNHLIFDGTDDYVSLNKMNVSGSAITLEAMINSSNLSNCYNNQCRIISKAVGNLENDHYWMLSTTTSGANTVLRFRLKTNGTTSTLIATIGAFSENTWYHVAATYNGTSMQLFLDGNQVGNMQKTGSLTTNALVDAWIGGNPSVATGYPWEGEIDEVRIWNTARTQAQIQATRNTELTGNEPGLLTYYKFNEGTGQLISDHAGNNNSVLGSTNNIDNNDPTFANSNTNVTFNLNVLLEGAYDSGQGSMRGNLLQRSIVPNGQPYTGSPWNYPGTEGSGWLPSDYPIETVDWVLVSLRESMDPRTEIARVASVLLKDGTISPFDINLNNTTNPLYVMIEHRNHLPIISAQPIPIVNGTISYDFSTQNSYNTTGFGQKQIGTNWMMYGGNADQDAQNSCDINAADRIFWQAVNGLFDVYNPGDYDLDGDINAADRIIHNLNNGIFSTIPKVDSEAEITCPATNFVLDQCVLTMNWVHNAPASTNVTYAITINGVGVGTSVTYPATSLSLDLCNALGISSGNGTFDVGLLYMYDGDLNTLASGGVCSVNYSIPPSQNCYDPWANNGTHLVNRVRRLMESPYRTGFGANTTGGTSNLKIVTNPAATGTGSYKEVIANAQSGDYIVFDPAHTVYLNGCSGTGCNVPGSVTIDGSLHTGQYVTLKKTEANTYNRSIAFYEGNNIVTNLRVEHDTKGSAVVCSNGENFWMNALRVIAKQDDALEFGTAITNPTNSADKITVSRYQVFSDSPKGLIVFSAGASCQGDPNIPGSNIAINQRRAHITVIDSELAGRIRNIFNKGGIADVIGCYIHGTLENSITRHGAQTIIRCSYIDSRTVDTRAVRADGGPYEVGGGSSPPSFCPDDSEVFLDNNLYRQVNFPAVSANPRINVSGSDVDTGAGGHMTNGKTNWNNPSSGRPVFTRAYEADVLPFCTSPTASSTAGPTFVLGQICP